VGAGEQLDEAQPGEVLADRGGGQGGVAGLLGLSPGGGAAEDVALGAPGGDVELGPGEAGQPAAPRVVDGGAVVVELAGELADRGGDRFKDAVLAEPAGEGGQVTGVGGVQADELSATAVPKAATGASCRR
jgi:hypothetical protein